MQHALLKIWRITQASIQAIAAVLALSALVSCAVSTSNDYGRYLDNNKVYIEKHANSTIACYFLPHSTQYHYYAFSSFMGGYHTTEWEVELGKVLDATLQRNEVKRQLGRLDKVSEPTCPSQDMMRIDVKHYFFTSCQAHVELAISVERDDHTILSRSYHATGVKQCGKMYWGGGFAMKNAVQQSTKSALDKVLNDFARDYAIASEERKSGQK